MAESLDELLEGQILELQVSGPLHEAVVAPQGGQDRAGPRCDHRVQVRAPAVLCVGGSQHGTPKLRRVVGLHGGEDDALSRGPRDAAKSADFVQELAVLRLHALELANGVRGNRLQDGPASVAHGRGDREQFSLSRESARHAVAGHRLVADDSGRAEAKRASPHRRAGNARHGFEVVGAGGFAGDGALAHHVEAQGSMGELGAHVEAVGPGVQVGQVLGKGLPLAPGHAFKQSGAGDVLDALHQVDEVFRAPLGNWCEAHAAVAHDHRGHAVGRRSLEPVVPSDLAVVVGVRIDPAGQHQGAIGINPAPGAGARRDLADLGDAAVGHADVRDLGFRTGAVDHGASLDDDVVHEWILPWGACGRTNSPRAYDPKCIRTRTPYVLGVVNWPPTFSSAAGVLKMTRFTE